MINNIENIFFDLDGTLTDSKKGIINSLLFALKQLNIEEHSINELDTFIGPPLRTSFKTRYNLSDDIAEKAIDFYREYFSEKGIFENELYSGVEDLLKSLFEKKYHLFLATSKPTFFADKVLVHFNIKKYFTGILGTKSDNFQIDKTEIISQLVSAYSLNPSNSVMIGDREHDITGGKNNSMKTIAVLYGYGSRAELLSHNPDYLVRTCDELKILL
jgi:phosphoglycolate phosphatase